MDAKEKAMHPQAIITFMPGRIFVDFTGVEGISAGAIHRAYHIMRQELKLATTRVLREADKVHREEVRKIGRDTSVVPPTVSVEGKHEMSEDLARALGA